MQIFFRPLLFLTGLTLVVAGCGSRLETVEETDELGYRKVFTVDPETGLPEGDLRLYDNQDRLQETAAYQAGKLDGTRVIYDENGDTSIVETYVNGLFEGPYRSYHPGGAQVKLEGNYRDNVMSGQWYKYHPNGQRAEVTTFVDNEENGPFQEWFENGTLAAEGSYLDGDNEHGRLRVYNEDGSLNRVMNCDRGACQSIWRDTFETPPPAREMYPGKCKKCRLLGSQMIATLLAMTYRLSAFLLFLLFSGVLFAQVGGISAYEFLNLPNSATVAAMGGHHMALRNDDLSLAARNPSLLNPAMDRSVALSHAFHPAGISNSYLGYGYDKADWKMTFQAGLQFVNYGDDLVRRDVTGQAMGTFNASDFAFTIGAARRIENRLTVGANLKIVSSQLAEYNSVGLASDLALHYRDTTGRLGISLLARNVGLQFGRYDESSGREPLPFELQVGLTRELEHLPFRFSIIYRYLDRWNVLYNDPDARDQSIFIGFDEEETERSAGSIWFDNFFRHFVVNGELMVGKKRNLRLRFGYNHGVRKELSLTDFRSLAGYTGGFALRAGRFGIAYGRTVYHIGGGINQLGLDIDLSKRR